MCFFIVRMHKYLHGIDPLRWQDAPNFPNQTPGVRRPSDDRSWLLQLIAIIIACNQHWCQNVFIVIMGMMMTMMTMIMIVIGVAE